jgi:hypothetical protein
MHFYGPVERVLVETGGLMSNAADDYWVNGGATTPTSAVDTTMSLGKGLASKVRGRPPRTRE